MTTLFERLGPLPTLLRRIKNSVLPRGEHVRTLPVGIGRGLRVSIDFRHQTGLFLGLYEIELNRYLRRLCTVHDNVFDVGGNIGYDALVFARLTGGRVASFEADPEMADRLATTFQANPAYASRLEIVRGFVGDIHNPASNLITLDAFAYANDFLPQVIKIDVEGAEERVLSGALRILEDERPRLLIEVHSVRNEQACCEILKTYNYNISVVEARCWLRDNRPLSHNRWLVGVSDHI